VEYHKLTDRRQGERSRQVRERVRLARERQVKRFAQLPRISANAAMGPAEVSAFCTLESAAEPLLQTASERLVLSARGVHRVLKLARTIADLAGCETIAVAHVAEALQYRPRMEVS
jgi:magnesium chelatase family protein